MSNALFYCELCYNNCLQVIVHCVHFSLVISCINFSTIIDHAKRQVFALKNITVRMPKALNLLQQTKKGSKQ